MQFVLSTRNHFARQHMTPIWLPKKKPIVIKLSKQNRSLSRLYIPSGKLYIGNNILDAFEIDSISESGNVYQR